ncbi:MAG: carbohydrate kinase family protein [Oscillospiraceae bacterium]|jgi:sugar/nucleoside kinase (ribokinase family)|nr:carbohydrate kinase family protein [Oscillospiraceae bacterium]
MSEGIACLGSLIVDVIKEIDAYPALGNLATVTDVSYATGGLVPNCLLDLAKMDPSLPLEAVGLVGRDAYGGRVAGALSAAGIDTRHIGRHPSLRTSFTDVMSCGRERSFFHYRGANAAFGPGHIPLDGLRAGILHFGYILLLDALDAPDPAYGTVLAGVLAQARARGFKTSVDVVSEQGDRFARCVIPSLRHADYCVVNEVEASAVTGIACRDSAGALLPERMRPICEKLRALGVKAWAVVHCPEGSFAAEESRFLSQPSLALPKSEIVGKTGAGDAFCAGVLYGAGQGMELREALRLATAAAAASLTQASASGGLRPVGELYQMIDRYGFEDGGTECLSH